MWAWLTPFVFAASVFWGGYVVAPLAHGLWIALAMLLGRGAGLQAAADLSEHREFWSSVRVAECRISSIGVITFVPVLMATITADRTSDVCAAAVEIMFALRWASVQGHVACDLQELRSPGATRRPMWAIVRLLIPACLRDAMEFRRGRAVAISIAFAMLTSCSGAVTFVTDNRAWAFDALHALRRDQGAEDHDEPVACPAAPSDVVTAIERKIPGAAGRRLSAAWAERGLAEIGCPQKYRRVDHLHVVSLAGGKEKTASLIGDGTKAAVVFGSDFEQVVLGELRLLQSVESRRRWGHGTSQVLNRRDGSCRLLQRYETAKDQTFEQTPAVTAVIAKVAVKIGAYPRMMGKTGDRPTIYQFRLLKPAVGGSGTRTVEHVDVSYDSTNGTAKSEGVGGRDTQRCPSEVRRLDLLADELERSAQRAAALRAERRTGRTTSASAEGDRRR